MVIREVGNLAKKARPVHAASSLCGQALCQPTIDWRVADQSQKLCSFEIGVKNIFILIATIHGNVRGF